MSDMCVVRAMSVLLMGVSLLVAEKPALICRHQHCQYLGHNKDTNYYKHFYKVDDTPIMITLSNSNRLEIDCNGAMLLESDALPRAEPALRVSQAWVTRCPLPSASSLADTLRKLNVTLKCDELNSTGDPCGDLCLINVPSTQPLTAKHFTGLEHLLNLNISGNNFSILTLQRGFLTPLQNLSSVMISQVALPGRELDVPLALRDLGLFHVNMKRLPMVNALEKLRLNYLMERQPAQLQRCDLLRLLELAMPAVNALPDGWLANCSCLKQLFIFRARQLYELPSRLLLSASALTHLVLTWGALETLPKMLLDYSPNLQVLNLNKNRLQTLPRDTFIVARQIQKLDLSANDLKNDALDALAPLSNLIELNLADNPRLDEICVAGGYLPTRNLTKLRKLFLSGTTITRICQHWKEDLVLLDTLDLSRTKIATLIFEDLQFTLGVEAEVVLEGTLVTVVEMTRKDYDDAVLGLNSGVSVRLDAVAPLPLDCDCRMYWTRRALNLSLPELQYVGGRRCNNGKRLYELSPENMMCTRADECTAAALPAKCMCAMWAADDPDHNPRLVRVRCEHAELYSVPRPQPSNHSIERFYELLLAHNHIADMQADDLQYNIKGLDLRYNLVREVDEKTAKRLGNIDGILYLAGNPFNCSCRAAPLLRALHDRSSARTDLRNATCSDGSPLGAASIVDCLLDVPFGTWIAGGLAALLALALTITACLASRQRRFFALAVLHQWGIMWHATESEEDSNRRYDAFLTFSHKDEATVHEVMARLEPPYRLCVHQRDWIPGHYICEQVMQSVQDSRRTVALVSKHFLESGWACAEFREAHAAAMMDARPRFIVVFLEDPASLDLDENMRRYVTTNTYLRWGEPWFWNKLAVAMPRPRPTQEPEPAPQASSPALALELTPLPIRPIH